MDESYTIVIDQFKGPFDLLLFFIERDELDIHDIPIAKITDDFLEYIRNLEQLNIDVASEFILVAATLMRIKARMLLPRKEIDEEGNEKDPREELVQKLIEYRKFKRTIQYFEDQESQRQQIFKRGNARFELKKLSGTALADIELESLSLYKLLSAFQRVMDSYKRQQQQQNQHIYFHTYHVEEQRSFILKKLSKSKKLHFEALFEHIENRIHAIVTFLALLELLNDKQVLLVQGQGTNNFWIRQMGE